MYQGVFLDGSDFKIEADLVSYHYVLLFQVDRYFSQRLAFGERGKLRECIVVELDCK